jgi:hypothetical protein
MNVKELIELLSKEDPKMRVVIQGYEQGYDEVHELEYVNILPNTDKDRPWWDGEFNDTIDKSTEVALMLPRGKRKVDLSK